MRYTMVCASKRHQDESTRTFEAFIHVAEGKRVDQCKCPECGGMAKRDLAADLKTIGIVGATPISLSTTGKGSLYHESKFAFGRFKQNPDGTVDTNHAPFRDSKELERFANGHNDLGPPKLDDSGNPIRRKDGSMVRTGAKLVKFDRHKAPPVSKKPRYDVPDAWVGDDVVQKAGRTNPISLRDANVSATRHRNPRRGN